MSLTSFLAIPEIRQRFVSEFPMPESDLSAPMLAPPITRNYPLVGTAFDYLMRFYLERLNPGSVTKRWVAEDAVELTRDDPKLFKKTHSILSQAKTIYSDYIKNGKLGDNVIKVAIRLAHLDPIYRAGIIDPNLEDVDDGDIEDLKNLIRIVRPELFRAKDICALNPTFGEASMLVGGADADLLIDSRLIDIKTTKNLKFTREQFNQLIGYYILSKIGWIDNVPDYMEIFEIGVYYSRHGLIHTIPASIIEEKPNIDDFISWFKKKAKVVFPQGVIPHRID